MRSLFLKIFLWYWLANILVFGVLAAVFMWAELGPPRGGFSRLVNRAMDAYGREAIHAFESHGKLALQDYVDELHVTTEMQMFLFDEQNRELLGQSVPPELQELVARVLREGVPQDEDQVKRMLAAAMVVGSSGKQYAVIGRGPRPFGLPIMPLVTLAVTATVVSYLLTRYVTAPVRRLRGATQQLAGGDLTTRVGPGMAKRRDLIGDLARDFDFMAERIESLMTAQQRLVRDVSHELRSPLARLNLALGLAAKQAGPGVQGSLDRIEREVERLNELIGQLLTLTKLESGTEAIEDTQIALAELVHQTAADADFEARNLGRRVRVSHCQDCTVAGSPSLLRSAVENVVRNAVRYTADRTEVEISLRCQSDEETSYAVIRVRDRGTGVPEAELPKIFQPFHRVDDARDRQTGGTGLGLAITERAVRLHGGTVSAANAQDGGLIVELRIPATTCRCDSVSVGPQ